LQFRWQGNG